MKQKRAEGKTRKTCPPFRDGDDRLEAADFAKDQKGRMLQDG